MWPLILYLYIFFPVIHPAQYKYVRKDSHSLSQNKHIFFWSPLIYLVFTVLGFIVDFTCKICYRWCSPSSLVHFHALHGARHFVASSVLSCLVIYEWKFYIKLKYVDNKYSKCILEFPWQTDVFKDFSFHLHNYYSIHLEYNKLGIEWM